MKRWIVLLLLAAVVLAGCSAKNSATQDYVSSSPAAGAESGAVSSAGDLALAGEADIWTAEPSRKLVRTVYLTAETEDFDTLLQNIAQQVSQAGGYAENREIYQGSAYQSSPSRTAQLTLRIPSQSLTDFVSQVGTMANIVSSTETAEDITLTYTDTESRLTALEVEQERLLELLAEAQTTQDLLEIESRLTDVRYALENAQSTLRLYDSLVDYSTVHLSIQEVQQLTPAQASDVWGRISQGFQQNLRSLGRFFTGLFVLLTAGAPIWVPLALVVAAVVLLFLRKKRRTKAAGKKENGETVSVTDTEKNSPAESESKPAADTAEASPAKPEEAEQPEDGGPSSQA